MNSKAKPVAILRFSPGEGPGYFATFLEGHSVPYRLVAIDRGDPVPAEAQEFAGLCFMGGHMSVNDDLPWIPPVLALIRQAVARDIPCIGHCLGGQLMSRALGGTVSGNPVKEIGWGEVTAADGAAAREWLGDTARFLSFHWHGETFSLPEGAQLLMSSPWCPRQGFVLGPHLGMQCHVEMTEDMIADWCRSGAQEIAANPLPSVQAPEEMQLDLPARLAGLRAVADRLYGRWIQGLR